jgi:uncharacterized protein with beta-barrel porin domain
MGQRLGNWVTVDNDGATKGYNFTTGGFIIGVDSLLSGYEELSDGLCL